MSKKDEKEKQGMNIVKRSEENKILFQDGFIATAKIVFLRLIVYYNYYIFITV